MWLLLHLFFKGSDKVNAKMKRKCLEKMKEKNIKQSDLAREMKCSRQTIYQILKTNDNISVRLDFEICEFLGVDYE